MILAKTRYKTYNGELLAIAEAFITCWYSLKSCKHKVFVLSNHNNLCRFMDTKSLSFTQVCWAQKLSKYYFRINYCQGKVNGATDALSRFSQRNKNEEEKFRAENTQIFHRLQFSLTNATSSGLSILASLLPLHQVFICGTYALPQLRRFGTLF